MNPYWGTHFLDFFYVLYQRVTGQLPLASLPPDEIQLLVLIGLSISTGILGTFLTLRKMTMLANSLSHTTLLGIVVCFLLTLHQETDLTLSLPLLFIASFVSACLTILLTEGVHRIFKIHEDAAIGLVFTTLFALGIVLVTLYTRNMHLGVEVITGNLDALSAPDVFYTSMIAIFNIIMLRFAYRPWTFTTFDAELAHCTGLKVHRYHYLQMGLTALTLVVAIKAVGVLLVLAFLVGPTLIARHYCQRLPSLLLGSCIIGIFFAIVGVALSRHFLSTLHLPLSTGGLIVTLLSLGYFISGGLTFRHPKSLIMPK